MGKFQLSLYVIVYQRVSILPPDFMGHHTCFVATNRHVYLDLIWICKYILNNNFCLTRITPGIFVFKSCCLLFLGFTPISYRWSIRLMTSMSPLLPSCLMTCDSWFFVTWTFKVLEVVEVRFFFYTLETQPFEDVSPILKMVIFHCNLSFHGGYLMLFSKVVSPHLWNTPLNLYQQTIKGFLS